MGSLNDYQYANWPTGEPAHQGPRRRPGGRFTRQLVLAAVFFFVVAASIKADNFLGRGARYIAREGISAANSWISLDDGAVPTIADGESEDEDDEQIPSFIAPASGVVVKDISVSDDGFSTNQGIIIQGAAGQTVKAAAAGEVAYLGESSDGYLVQVQHSGGFVSVYQGLQDLKVTAGQSLVAGDPLGISENGELLFCLLLNEEEVDPLQYLFGDYTEDNEEDEQETDGQSGEEQEQDTASASDQSAN